MLFFNYIIKINKNIKVFRRLTYFIGKNRRKELPPGLTGNAENASAFNCAVPPL